MSKAPTPVPADAVKPEPPPSPPTKRGDMKIQATQDEIASTFTEWERRYREEPGRFYSEAKKLLTDTPESYGEACAPYFLKILGEIRTPRTPEEG